jgi:hypothetical protein
MWDPVKDEVEKFLQGLQKVVLNYASGGSAADPVFFVGSIANIRFVDRGFWP